MGLEIPLADSIRVTVNAYGTWTTKTTQDSSFHVSGSPYAIDLRVYGAGDSVRVSDLQIEETGDSRSSTIASWTTRTYSRRTRAHVFATAPVVALRPVRHRVSGTIVIGSGSSEMRKSFSGNLEYVYREELRNKARDAVGGV